MNRKSKLTFLFILFGLCTVAVLFYEAEFSDRLVTHSKIDEVSVSKPKAALELATPLNSGIRIPTHTGDELEVKGQVSNPSPLALAQLPIGEEELNDPTGSEFSVFNWSNLGFGTINSVLQTYYWSMHERQLPRLLECMSPSLSGITSYPPNLILRENWHSLLRK